MVNNRLRGVILIGEPATIRPAVSGSRCSRLTSRRTELRSRPARVSGLWSFGLASRRERLRRLKVRSIWGAPRRNMASLPACTAAAVPIDRRQYLDGLHDTLTDAVERASDGCVGTHHLGESGIGIRATSVPRSRSSGGRRSTSRRSGLSAARFGSRAAGRSLTGVARRAAGTGVVERSRTGAARCSPTEGPNAPAAALPKARTPVATNEGVTMTGEVRGRAESPGENSTAVESSRGGERIGDGAGEDIAVSHTTVSPRRTVELQPWNYRKILISV